MEDFDVRMTCSTNRIKINLLVLTVAGAGLGSNLTRLGRNPTSSFSFQLVAFFVILRQGYGVDAAYPHFETVEGKAAVILMHQEGGLSILALARIDFVPGVRFGPVFRENIA